MTDRTGSGVAIRSRIARLRRLQGQEKPFEYHAAPATASGPAESVTGRERASRRSLFDTGVPRALLVGRDEDHARWPGRCRPTAKSCVSMDLRPQQVVVSPFTLPLSGVTLPLPGVKATNAAVVWHFRHTGEARTKGPVHRVEALEARHSRLQVVR